MNETTLPDVLAAFKDLDEKRNAAKLANYEANQPRATDAAKSKANEAHEQLAEAGARAERVVMEKGTIDDRAKLLTMLNVRLLKTGRS